LSEATLVVTGEAAPATSPSVSIWIKGLGPLILIAALVFAFLRFGPLGIFQQVFPPVEELTIERITLPRPGEMRVHVVNGGPEPVTIAQVLVDDAAWAHTLDGSRVIRRLESRTITVPYPWVEGEPHKLAILTSTGLTFSGEVAVATQTPSIGPRYLATFAALGIYVGVIPVFLGLLWLPFLRSMHRRWIDFFLSLTVGLLIFLGADALAEALEIAAVVPGAFQGQGLVLLGALGTPLVLTGVARRKHARGPTTALSVATLIALGIGFHNLGEGLVVGSAYATGEIALGNLLVVGFLLHNTTEGLGIVAPIAKEPTQLRQLVLLGALAGVPTVLGAWIGGFAYSPTWTTLLFAAGAGAVAQIVYRLWRFFNANRDSSLADPLNAAGLILGLVIMYATGLFVAA
jgi:zinc transporter ZupT